MPSRSLAGDRHYFILQSERAAAHEELATRKLAPLGPGLMFESIPRLRKPLQMCRLPRSVVTGGLAPEAVERGLVKGASVVRNDPPRHI